MESDAVVGVGLGLFMFVFALFWVGLAILSLFWVYADAEARGKSGCLVAFLVFLVGWPLSLLAWLVFRPEERQRY